MQVACPTCKKQILWDVQNQYRPFCCKRCKLIDLGAWADGSYSIPDQPLTDQELEDNLKDGDSEDEQKF